MPAIMGSVAGAILYLLGKAVGFVAKHSWALIVFVAGLIGVWLMQRVSKKQPGKKESFFCGPQYPSYIKHLARFCTRFFAIFFPIYILAFDTLPCHKATLSHVYQLLFSEIPM